MNRYSERRRFLRSRYYHDRFSDRQEKLDDYGDFRIPFVWVIDPRTQRGYTYSLKGGFNMQPGLRTTNPDIELAIEPLFE